MQHRVCPLLVAEMRRAESNHDEERAVALLWVVCGFGDSTIASAGSLAHTVNR